MIRYIYLSLLSGLCIFFLNACGENASEQARQVSTTDQYFDVAGFIKEQIILLNKENPAAVKTVTENNSQAETKQLQSLDWQDELESFTELDINKPAFQQAYTSRQQQDANGLTTITYTRKPGADGNIEYLTVSTDANGQVKYLRGVQKSKNILIQTYRELNMQCYTKNGSTRVSSYSIQGLQKPIILKGLRYKLITRII